jgi:uncharacterized metal-binding protein
MSSSLKPCTRCNKPTANTCINCNSPLCEKCAEESPRCKQQGSEVAHLLNLIELEYASITWRTENINKFVKRMEGLVGVDEAARLISNIFATQPLEDEGGQS